MASAAARIGRITSRISSITATSEATVAIGPSRRMDRIIEAKMTAPPEVSRVFSVPPGWLMCSRCSTVAIFSRSRPFQTEIPSSTG